MRYRLCVLFLAGVVASAFQELVAELIALMAFGMRR
jgi:hypothetical protein